MAQGTALLDFGAFPGASDCSIAVTGQTGILAGSLVEAWILPAATADHSADEQMLEPLQIFAGNIVAGTGFTIYGVNNNHLTENPLGAVAGQNRAGAVGKGTLLYGKFNVGWVWN